MMDLTGEVSSGAVDMAKLNLEKMLKLCASPITMVATNPEEEVKLQEMKAEQESFIDIDDYTMHAFRIPKKLEKECDECGYVDDAVASHYEECSKLKTDE